MRTKMSEWERHGNGYVSVSDDGEYIYYWDGWTESRIGNLSEWFIAQYPKVVTAGPLPECISICEKSIEDACVAISKEERNKEMKERDAEVPEHNYGYWNPYGGFPFAGVKPKELTAEEKQKKKQSEDISRAMRTK